MDGTIITQGRFTANGSNVNLAIPSNVDFMWVYNATAIATIGGAADLGTTFYWQRGFPSGTAFATVKLDTVANDPLTMGVVPAPLGFTTLDQGNDPLISASVATAATSNNVNPAITTSSIAASGIALKTGDVVRLSQSAALLDRFALNGIDFQITVNNNLLFTITNALANTVGASANAGFWRKVNVSSIFYPQYRFIVNITRAANAVVTTSVDHGYRVGQKVRFNLVSPQNAMTQINQLTATINAVTASTFTTDLDTSAFNAFVFPTNATIGANGDYTPATVNVFGQNTALSLANNVDTLADAVVNTSIIGMTLGGAAAAGLTAGPAGAIGDVMYWVAGKSYLVDNR